MSIFTGELVQSKNKPTLEDRKSTHFMDATRRHPMLKELSSNIH